MTNCQERNKQAKRPTTLTAEEHSRHNQQQAGQFTKKNQIYPKYKRKAKQQHLLITFLSYLQSLSECSKENRFMVYFCREWKQQITDCHHYSCDNCLCGINRLYYHHLFKKEEAKGESRK